MGTPGRATGDSVGVSDVDDDNVSHNDSEEDDDGVPLLTPDGGVPWSSDDMGRTTDTPARPVDGPRVGSGTNCLFISDALRNLWQTSRCNCLRPGPCPACGLRWSNIKDVRKHLRKHPRCLPHWGVSCAGGSSCGRSPSPGEPTPSSRPRGALGGTPAAGSPLKATSGGTEAKGASVDRGQTAALNSFQFMFDDVTLSD